MEVAPETSATAIAVGTRCYWGTSLHHTQRSVGTTEFWREKVECDASHTLASFAMKFDTIVVILHAIGYSE